MTDHRLQNGLPRVQASPGSRLPWLVELAAFLFGRDYDAAEQNAVLVSVCDTGSLVTASERGHLDPEDYEAAERVFVDSQPDVPQDDSAWGPPIGQPGTELWTTEPPQPPGTVQAGACPGAGKAATAAGLAELAAGVRLRRNSADQRRGGPRRPSRIPARPDRMCLSGWPGWRRKMLSSGPSSTRSPTTGGCIIIPGEESDMHNRRQDRFRVRAEADLGLAGVIARDARDRQPRRLPQLRLSWSPARRSWDVEFHCVNCDTLVMRCLAGSFTRDEIEAEFAARLCDCCGPDDPAEPTADPGDRGRHPQIREPEQSNENRGQHQSENRPAELRVVRRLGQL